MHRVLFLSWADGRWWISSLVFPGLWNLLHIFGTFYLLEFFGSCLAGPLCQSIFEDTVNRKNNEQSVV